MRGLSVPIVWVYVRSRDSEVRRDNGSGSGVSTLNDLISPEDHETFEFEEQLNRKTFSLVFGF